MSENGLKVGVFEGMGSVWPKILGTRVISHKTILPVRKLDEWAFYTV